MVPTKHVISKIFLKKLWFLFRNEGKGIEIEEKNGKGHKTLPNLERENK